VTAQTHEGGGVVWLPKSRVISAAEKARLEAETPAVPSSFNPAEERLRAKETRTADPVEPAEKVNASAPQNAFASTILPSFVPPEIRAAMGNVWKPPDKCPRIPEGDGPLAKNNDPSTWRPWDDCVAFAAARGWGVGVETASFKDVVTFELDRCLVDGMPEDWAQEIFDRVSTFTVITQSLKGLRFFVRGTGRFPSMRASVRGPGSTQTRRSITSSP
jgi:hypothetical protein